MKSVASKNKYFLFFAFVVGVLAMVSGAIDSIVSIRMNAEDFLRKVGVLESRGYPVLLRVSRQSSDGRGHAETSHLGQDKEHCLEIMISNATNDIVFDEILVRHFTQGAESSWGAAPVEKYDVGLHHFEFEKTIKHFFESPIAFGPGADGPLRLGFCLRPEGVFGGDGVIFVMLGYTSNLGERRYLPVYQDSQVTKEIMDRGYVYFPRFPPSSLYVYDKAGEPISDLNELDVVRKHKSELVGILGVDVSVIKKQLKVAESEDLRVEGCHKLNNPLPLELYVSLNSPREQSQMEEMLGISSEGNGISLIWCYFSMLRDVHWIDMYALNENGKVTGELLGAISVGELIQRTWHKQEPLTNIYQLMP